MTSIGYLERTSKRLWSSRVWCMFAKPASFKPYAAIKNSERKKNLAKIESQCGLAGESPELRQLLLPKTVQSAKALTHGGEKITVLADSQLPLWVIPKSNQLVPTVALLTSLPEEFQLRLLPSIYTVSRTLQFLSNGADFMVPGIFGHLPSTATPPGTVVAIRDVESRALLATGITLVDLSRVDPEKDKGKCVQTISVIGDKLTPETHVKPLSSKSNTAGSAAAAAVEAEPTKEDAAEKMAMLELEEKHHQSEPKAPPEEAVAANICDLDTQEDSNEELSVKEADEAFMYALNRVIREPRNYPVTMAGFAALLGENMPYEHPQLLIKNTSFKKMNKLIKHADKLGLLTSRERQGGEVLVTGVNVPVGEAAQAVAPPVRKQANIGKDKMNVLVAYKPHPNVKLVAPNLDELVDAATMKKHAFSFIQSAQLQDKPGDEVVKVDDNLRKALALKQTQKTVPRDDVAPLLLKNSSPFHKVVPSGVDPATLKWQKGCVPAIQIKTERRGGNKTVTLVGTAGLQGFNIDPQSFADELRHACAGSAALTDSKGFPAITVQGNHTAKITRVLELKGVRPAWIK